MASFQNAAIWPHYESNKMETANQLRIATVNRKGGVGKTTTTVGLASAFASKGRRTLVVDLDPQANATYSLGCSDYSAPGAAALLLGEEPVFQKVAPNLEVLAAERLEDSRITTMDPEELYFRVQSLEHDVILFDVPPSAENMERLALVASTTVLIPVNAHTFAAMGAGRILSDLRRRQERGQRGPGRWALIRSRVDKRRAADRELASDLESAYPGVKQLELVQDAELMSATDAAELIFDVCPQSRGALCLKDIMNWTEER